MVTSKEQTRIIEDERKRKEVQNLIKKTETRSVWKLLNEPFSLWLLSTIVVGLFTFTYAQLNAYIKAREDRRTRLEKLDVQAASRVEFTVERRKQATDVAQYADLLRTLLQDTDDTRMFPEFRDRSTLSILWDEAQLRKTIWNPTPHNQQAQHTISYFY